MEKELIRFENVTSFDTQHSNIKNFSFVIYEGQTIGMVALNNTGSDVLLNLLQSNTMDITGNIYIRSKLVHNHNYCDSSKNDVAIVDHNNRLFESLSTVDNIFLTPRLERHGVIIPRKKEKSRFLWIKSELELDLEINKNCENISNADRCIIEILRAVMAEKALIVLVGLSNFLTKREYKKVYCVIQQFRSKGQTFLIIGNNYNQIIRSTDFTILLRDGKNIKRLTKEKYPDEQELLRCLEADWNESNRIEQICFPKTNDVILAFKHVYSQEMRNISFELYKGECIVLIANQKVQNNIIALLQKKINADEGKILFEGEDLGNYSSAKLFPYKINFILSNAYRKMLYMDLNYMENLTIGIEKKSHHQIVRKSVKKLLYSEAKKELGNIVSCKYISELTKEEKYELLYSRILFLHPQLVIICNPFIESDYQTRAFISDLLYRLRKAGITLLILSAGSLKKMKLADKIIEIHNKIIWDFNI